MSLTVFLVGCGGMSQSPSGDGGSGGASASVESCGDVPELDGASSERVAEVTNNVVRSCVEPLFNRLSQQQLKTDGPQPNGFIAYKNPDVFLSYNTNIISRTLDEETPAAGFVSVLFKLPNGRSVMLDVALGENNPLVEKVKTGQTASLEMMQQAIQDPETTGVMDVGVPAESGTLIRAKGTNMFYYTEGVAINIKKQDPASGQKAEKVLKEFSRTVNDLAG